MSDMTLQEIEKGYEASMWVLESFEALLEGETPAGSSVDELLQSVRKAKEDMYDAWARFVARRLKEKS